MLLCGCTHTRVTIMYCGIQECHGQRGQLVRFSCNTDSISEMTNNNLLFLCPPRAKVSCLKEWEQKQDQFCAWAACCCRCEAFKYTLFCESLCFAVEETQSSFQQGGFIRFLMCHPCCSFFHRAFGFVVF